MSFNNGFTPKRKKVLSPSLTNNNYAHLRIFHSGLHIDLCIEPGSNFGCLFPSMPVGILIKQGSLSALKAKGVIESETRFHQRVEYKRFTITDFGKATFERYNHACSN